MFSMKRERSLKDNRDYNNRALGAGVERREAWARICSLALDLAHRESGYMFTPGIPVAVGPNGKCYADVCTDGLGETQVVSTACLRCERDEGEQLLGQVTTDGWPYGSTETVAQIKQSDLKRGRSKA